MKYGAFFTKVEKNSRKNERSDGSGNRLSESSKAFAEKNRYNFLMQSKQRKAIQDIKRLGNGRKA